MDRDTHKQRKLARTLAMAGHGGSWRRFLLDLKEDGYSDAEIAAKLRQGFDIPIDPTTVGEWRRQAQAEAQERPASGATDRAA
jgi:hypothetical protein